MTEVAEVELEVGQVLNAFEAERQGTGPRSSEWQVARRLWFLRQQQAWLRTGHGNFGALAGSLGLTSRRAVRLADFWQAWSAIPAALQAQAMQRLTLRKASLLVPLLPRDDVSAWIEKARRLSMRALREQVHRLLHPAVATDQSGLLSPVVQARNWQIGCPDPDFFVEAEHWRQLCFAGVYGQNVLLIGHSGSGKTELLDLVAAALERPSFVINFGATSEPRSALLGTTHFDRRTGTFFAESAFLKATQIPGTLIILDELSRCRPEAYNIILPLLDGQRTVAVDERSDSPILELAEGVSFMATANVGLQYAGTEQLDHAVLDRFAVVLEIAFPPQAREIRLLVVRTGVAVKSAEVLVKLAADQRSMTAEGAFVSPLSTRTLLATAFQAARGIPLREAVNACMLARFSAEGGAASERSQFQVLVQKYLGAV